MKKIKIVNILLIIIIIILFCIAVNSLIHIINWKKDNNKTDDELNIIKNNSEIKEVVDNEKTEIINNEEIPKSDPYWDYIKMNMIDADFNNLKEINSDVKGWIYVPNTNINYPFVQYKNNSYYLNRSFEKKKSEAGWIFADYRNDLTNFDKNTIIYGHNRLNKTMFGSLKDATSKKWLNNKDNHIIKLSTEKENTLWQVFSLYKIETTDDYLYINFNNETEYTNFIKLIKNRSMYNFKSTVTSNDKILTLSTCNGSKQKLVMHAKLIKTQQR